MMLKFLVVLAVVATAVGFKMQMKAGEMEICSKSSLLYLWPQK